MTSSDLTTRELSIHDVAREAGVSIATVSRVINGRSRVAAETRRRVERAMARLQYNPNLRARALSLGRTDTIGLILPDLFGDYFGELMRGVDEAAREAGMHMIVSRAVGPEDERKLVCELLFGGRVDGLIIMISQETDGLPGYLEGVREPLLVLDKDVGNHPIDNILVDNRTGARDATHHLIDVHGVTELVFIGGPAGNIDARDRSAGFRDALAAAERIPKPTHVRFTNYSYEAGYNTALEFANQLGPKWGIVAGNDDVARGAIDALLTRGIRVPEDVAVVGYDDSRIASLARPALTTVRVPLREMGHEAVATVLDRTTGHRTLPRQSILKPRLIVRRSCGCNG